MMKAIRALRPFAFAAALLVALPASAQNLKIGVVNFQALVQQAPQFEQMTQSIDTEFADRRRTLQNLQSQLEEKSQQLDRDGAVMPDSERQTLERELRDGSRDFERQYGMFQEDMNARFNEELNRVQREVLQKVHEYAENEDYDLIVAEALYFDGNLDITADVLESLSSDGGRRRR